MTLLLSTSFAVYLPKLVFSVSTLLTGFPQGRGVAVVLATVAHAGSEQGPASESDLCQRTHLPHLSQVSSLLSPPSSRAEVSWSLSAPRVSVLSPLPGFQSSPIASKVHR